VNQRQGRIYLPSQICYKASLPEGFTKDFNAARAIQPFKISTAMKRYEKIMALVSQFSQCREFKSKGIEMDQKMFKIETQVMEAPTIKTGKGVQPIDSFYNRKVPIMQSLAVKSGEWAFVYNNRDYDLANDIIESFEKAQGALGMSFKGEPIWVEVPDDRDLQ